MRNMIHDLSGNVKDARLSEERIEQYAYQVFNKFLDDNKELLGCISRYGDGRCGLMIDIMQEKLCGPKPEKPGYQKKRIRPGLRKQVLERDAYRCKRCGTHIDLCVDHVIPETLGGPATLENLQVLCRPCNSKKGVGI